MTSTVPFDAAVAVRQSVLDPSSVSRTVSFDWKPPRLIWNDDPTVPLDGVIVIAADPAMPNVAAMLVPPAVAVIGYAPAELPGTWKVQTKEPVVEVVPVQSVVPGEVPLSFQLTRTVLDPGMPRTVAVTLSPAAPWSDERVMLGWIQSAPQAEIPLVVPTAR